MWRIILLVLFTQKCRAVIFQLNDTEYERMPPLFELDQYEPCLRKSNGPYCLTQLDLYADPPNDLIDLIKEYSENTIKHYNHTYIQRGVCVATACKDYIDETNSNSLDLNAVLETCLNRTIWNNYGLQAKLTHVYYCDKLSNGVEYDWSDWLFGVILLALLIFNIIGSLYDYTCEIYPKNEKDDEYRYGNPYLLCFSIFQNWKNLISTEFTNPRHERLRGLHGIRALTSSVIAVAHVMWLIGAGFTDNPLDFEKTSESIHYQIIFNGMMIVQIFFVASGFLLVYNMQIISESVPVSWSLLPRLFLNRWWRLTPANALMIAFTATWLRYLGSGPLWNLYVMGPVSDCRQYWWTHVLYINNYVPDDKALSNRSATFLFGINRVYSNKVWGRTVTLLLLLLLSMAAPALHVWLQDLDALVILKPEFYRTFSNDTYRYLHVLGHNNLSCFIIGMIAGYLAYFWQKEKVEVFKHKIWKYLTWCVIPAVLAMFLSGHMFYAEAERPSVISRMLYAAVHRAAFGVIVVFFILGLITKIESVQRPLFEWSGWLVPSKLSYCAYLLHLNVVHVLLGSRTQLGHVSFFYVVINHLGVVTLSFLSAVPFYLMVEAPFSRLMKTILAGARGQRPKRSYNDTILLSVISEIPITLKSQSNIVQIEKTDFCQLFGTNVTMRLPDI